MFEKQKAAHKAGKRIQCKLPDENTKCWSDISNPSWNTMFQYRIHPADDADFKLSKEAIMPNTLVDIEKYVPTKNKIAIMQAFCEGKKIEYQSHMGKGWHGVNEPAWDWPRCSYRVAPIVEEKTLTVSGKKVVVEVTIANGEVVDVKLKGK